MRRLSSLVFLFLPAIAGCTPLCPAVDVIYNWPAARIFDSAGEPIADATVTYAAAGDEPRPCEHVDDGYYGCGETDPEPGLFILRATCNDVSVTRSLEISEVGECGDLVGGVADIVLPDEPTAALN